MATYVEGDEGMSLTVLPAAEPREPDAALGTVESGNAFATAGARRIIRTLDGAGHFGRSPDQAFRTFLDPRGEREAVDGLLTGARGGAGGSLVLHGERGSGKTTLLGYAAEQASGMRSVRVKGIESEQQLAFAAAHQLLVPFLPRLARIPRPQRDALRTVVGLAPGPTPDRFLVGLAMLALLVDGTRDQPLLVAVDDAHWLDQTSAQLLSFVARRVSTHPIAFLVAVRQPAPRDMPFAELPTRYLAAPPEGRTIVRAVGVTEARPITSWLDQRAAPRERRHGHAVPAAVVHHRPDADDQAVSRDHVHALGRYPAVHEVSAGPLETGSPTAPGALLRDGLAARLTDGYPAAVPLLRAAVRAVLAGSAAPDADGYDLFAAATGAAGDVMDDGARYALAARWVRVERDRGGANRLPAALSSLAKAEVQAGWLASAEAHLAEARQVAAATATLTEAGAVDLAELTVLAWRGREEDARSAAARLSRSCPGVAPAVAATATRSALAVLELAMGHYHAALDCTRHVDQHDPLDLGTHILPDLVEAASRVGDRAAATAALERFTGRALASGTPLALGLLSRCRALLADDTAADGLYHEAREHLRQTSAVPELARTHLLHGEWLRRQRRRRDARQQLRAAVDLFEAMGMDAFARRARVELSATGERLHKRVDGSGNELTPQESQIAQLVADGLANREIATHLFISPNTVEYHLQKVFRKLAVTSRTQLARALLIGARSADAA
jgi:DNA-binding CsgD family transcriptional regulator